MTKLGFATNNAHKLREASEILGADYELARPAEFVQDFDPEETGDTLEENALIKVRAMRKFCPLACLADDTALEVDALGGAPGIYTARYAGGEGHDSEANMRKLLSELEKCGPGAPRTARFHTVVAYIGEDGGEHCFEGIVNGRIAMQKAGCGGFGYDPVFIADEYPDRTVAELPEEVKNSISHRARALKALVDYLDRK